MEYSIGFNVREPYQIIDYIKKTKLDSAQTFIIRNKNKYDLFPFSYESFKGLKHIYIHSTFNMILGPSFSMRTFYSHLEALKKTFNDSPRLKGLIIHLADDPIDTTANYMRSICTRAAKYNINIIFENPPLWESNGFNYSDINNLVALSNHNAIKGIKNWGFCIDTAHVYTSGIDISNKKISDTYFEELFKKVNRVKLIHLNGNSVKPRTEIDKHEYPCSEADLLWNKNCDLFNHVFSYIKARQHIIFELDLKQTENYEKLLRKLNSAIKKTSKYR
jgi:sugar phosphate isomerase/epimerase